MLLFDLNWEAELALSAALCVCKPQQLNIRLSRVIFIRDTCVGGKWLVSKIASLPSVSPAVSSLESVEI